MKLNLFKSDIEKRFVLSYLLFLLIPLTLKGQDNRILVNQDIVYEYISRLQQRGFLIDLNPTSQPYTFREVSESINTTESNKLSELEKKWITFIKKRLGRVSKEFGIEANTTTYLSDTKRLNTLEPLNRRYHIFAAPNFAAYTEHQNFIVQGGLTHNFYYDQDPDGLDASRRLYIRSEDTYLGYQNSNIKAYLGRFSNNWSYTGTSSTLLSNHAYSFDQFNLSFKGKYISFQSILGELDGLNENGTFNGQAFRPGSIKRYISLRKLDWRIKKNFQLSYFESVIYTGEQAGLSLKYLTPLHMLAFVTDNNPKNEDVNLFVGTMFWWNFQKTTVTGQLMLDDMHFLDNKEVTTFSSMLTFNLTELVQNTDIGMEIEAVAYQTYNAPDAEERYLYLGKGIATRNTDYVLGKIYSKIYLDEHVNGLTITPSLTYYLQGEQTINQPIVRNNPDGSLIDIILTGEVEKTLRAGINIFYNPHPNFWFELNTGYNKVDNYMNVNGAANNRFSTIAKIGFRFGLYHSN